MRGQGYRVRKLAVFALIVGCGTRSGLDQPEPRDASVPDLGSPRACASDAECDDGVTCTLDRCGSASHVCEHDARDSACGDGLYCSGTKRCDPNKGCVAIAVPCDDGVSCTNDTCEEAKKSCRHDPDDSKCPISHACNPIAGCEQRAFVHSDTVLYDLRLPSGTIKPIGTTNINLTDIALHPNNTLYGFSYARFYTVSQTTGAATFVRTLADSINGADVDPNGTMYVAGTSSLYTLDISTGVLTFVTSFAGGEISSGDLAFVGTRLFATAHVVSSADDLIEFDVVNKTSKLIGPIASKVPAPYSCVWALAAFGQSLYGMNCDGAIIGIDPTTAVATHLKDAKASFWGATAR